MPGGRLRREVGRVARFGIVGVVATVVHVAVAFAVLAVVGPVVAAVIGFLAANGVSYLGHRLWTFRETQRSVIDGAWRHLVVSAFGMGINVAMVACLGYLGAPAQAAVLAGALVAPPLTYLGARHWAFAVSRPATMPGADRQAR